MLGLVILSPLLLLVAVAVKLGSRGPALFRHERVGFRGKPFRLLKFRTMRMGEGGPELTRSGDDRITPLGRLLRATKVDELPQLWNVLRGEMSLVGPRPEVARYVDRYTAEQRRVLDVRPGITDWASIEFRDEEKLLAQADDVEQYYVTRVLPRKLALNLRYIDEMSVITDLRIMAVTAWRVFVPLLSFQHSARVLQYALDFSVLVGSFLFAYVLRFEGIPKDLHEKEMIFQLPYVVLLQFLMFQLVGIYSFIWRYIGLREVRSFLSATGGVAVVLTLVRLLAPAQYHYARVPLSVIFMDALLVFSGAMGLRVARRAGYERSQRRRRAAVMGERRVLLIGAGRAGVVVCREIQSRGDTGIEPVGFVDDDAAKQGTVIQGVKVIGTTDELPQLVRETAVDHVIITIANTPAREIRRIVSVCERIPIRVRIIPGLYEILEEKVSISRIRDVQIEDLLGRAPVELLRDSVEKLVRGQVVLVTGAGGSIGSGLCRQVCHYGAGQLVMVEQAETPLFDIHRELRVAHPHISLVPAIADVCDASRMNHLLLNHRPDVILHAAAHKHVPMMEYNPGEAIKNNVIGTQVVADMALRHRVGTFVLISTDKAVNPTSIMGASKRLAEMYVQGLSGRGRTKFVAVRFGNVLGSTGSVVRIFKEQIAAGGPVTVTHPDMKRYFMTIEEATQLVLQAADLGESGEIMVLDMGEPVLVLDLAKDMITLSGLRPYEDVDIVFSGVRPGEKLFEELGFDDEKMDRTRHSKIFVGKIRPQSAERVNEIMAGAVMIGDGSSVADVRDYLRGAVPECQFTPVDAVTTDEE